MASLNSRIHEARELLAALEAEQAAIQNKKSNGNVHTNIGNGFQNIDGSKINNGDYAGDNNTHHFIHNNGNGPTINNSGQFRGNGNGGYYNGNFDASTRNYGYGPGRQIGRGWW